MGVFSSIGYPPHGLPKKTILHVQSMLQTPFKHRIMGCCGLNQIDLMKGRTIMVHPNKLELMITAGGRISCRRCEAMSKRTRVQCGAPAISGKAVCRFHGGLSTGPRTEAGRARCAAAKTIHGESSRKARAEFREEMIQLAMLEELGQISGLIVGTRTRGRRPGS